AFGIAVSGMHYTAMYGVHFVDAGPSHHAMGGLAASQQILSVVVALLCFVIAAGFLLSLVPDPRRHDSAVPAAAIDASAELMLAPDGTMDPAPAAIPAQSRSAPLGGLGQPRGACAFKLPVEGPDGTRFIDSGEVRSVRADAHYTRVHDGTRERMCPWSISEAEAQLDSGAFVRVHRSYIVAIPHVVLVRKEGDGAVVELDGTAPHLVPVSRARIAEVKARLGLAPRNGRAHAQENRSP
ncbi:MAG: LytTR family transcriptional regulator DNA-binding domain-containing protein, partial [Tardiphaga sp.]